MEIIACNTHTIKEETINNITHILCQLRNCRAASVSEQSEANKRAPFEPAQYFEYRMAGNFGGKIVWRIAENMPFGGIYFGG